jgi:alkaline phosphatase D
MIKQVLSIFLLLCFSACDLNNIKHIKVNAPLLLSGPYLGYTEHFEQLIFMELNMDVKSVRVEYWPHLNKNKVEKITFKTELSQKFNPYKIVLPYLEMGTKYQYRLFLNDIEQQIANNTFNTKVLWEWRQPKGKGGPDFSFLFGSCVYINDSTYDRPGKPYGQSYRIFDSMATHSTDFTLWGGDNIYLREVDWSSKSGINYRYHHTRRNEHLDKIMSSRPNYAIWDDHDFGPNNSHTSYPLKEESLKAFKDWWGNKTYGEPDNKGTYSTFQWSDVDFFLLDNRYHRSGNKMPNDKNKAYLGEKQLTWLKNALVESRATFKLIVNGNQFFNNMAYNECYMLYENEFNDLISFIKNKKIRGLVFLSGDRHLSEIYKIENDNYYPFYEITCSPFTPRAYDITGEPEFNNPIRIKGSLVMEQNFMKISVNGDKYKRKISFKTYNIENDLVFKYEISENELRYK